ncbi:MAG: serine/threonine-protein kinase [Anaerolineales bacterium]|nr:serine/threonine-protein kinase [Anaerolineales bacterium]MCX7754927.1 serine/threonine-protein kinase [Anaerolineales bacterium]MDW8278142.1 protein kinase [Anaerolineales bacterium]
MTLEQGTLLNGRYRIVDILGQGGMGSVYRALDENLGVEVAVKENLFTTDEYSRQFRLEAVILASLRHQNLPRVTDHFVMEGYGQYLVMDYIEGEDLRQRMERMDTIPEEDAILIGAAVCDALAYLHSRRPPVLHRDIKPGNIKITPDGRVYLVDFGLAKLIQGSQTTTTGARAMTPGYSPPEQYGTARTDPRSDIYSLGATLYAALTGHIPEDGLARVMDNIELTPIRKHNPKISRRLAAVIEKAMEAYPDDRYQTAEEFRRGLLNSSSKTQRFTDLDLNISVPPPPEDEEAQAPKKSNISPSTPAKAVLDVVTSMTTRMRRRARRNATLGIWGGAILLLLAILLLWNTNPGLLWRIFPAIPNPTPDFNLVLQTTPTPDIPLVPPVQETPTPTFTPSPAPTDTPLPSPTATPLGGGTGQLAFVSSRTGYPQVYIINADGSGLRQITNEQEGACQPDWSPDGKRLVYVSPCRQKQDYYQGSSLYIIDANGENRTPLPTSLGGDFEPAWSPDGKRIAFTSLRDGYMEIYMINLETGQVTRLTRAQSTPTGLYARMAAWNPIGFQIAYVLKRAGTTQIWITTDGDVYLPKPNDQIAQTGSNTNDFLPVWTRDGQYIIFSQTNFEGTAPAWLMNIRYEDRKTKQAVRLPIEPLPIVDVSISPDGFWMAFESWPDSTNHDIYISTLTGANRVRLTTDPGFDFDPVWRPTKTE